MSVVPAAKSNLEDRILGEVKMNCFIALLGRGTQWICPLKIVCLNQGGLAEEFYSNGSRVGLLRRIGVCAGPAPL